MSDAPQRGRPEQREFDPEEFEMVRANTSCNQCAHQPVCALYNRMVNVVIEASNTQEPLIDPAELAKICPEYAPVDE